MNAHRLELPNYTRDQVAEHFREAIALVADLDVAPDLEPALILKAVELLAAKQVVITPDAGGILTPSGPAF